MNQIYQIVYIKKTAKNIQSNSEANSTGGLILPQTKACQHRER